MPAADVVTGRCSVEEILSLRARVLRPGQEITSARFDGDLSPTTAHFCAWAGGEIVGVGTVWPEAPPWRPGGTGAWRLRGMATDPGWRSLGVGRLVLEAALGHVRAQGGNLLWCNARLRAVGFYQRAGLRTVGERWEEPGIGPHIAMEMHLSA
ncbi:MAG TPA: GNAT family N-acetyltransferase [Acidimicrobiales bacterium]|nr:GNAT family N-acetyltransferase [Acidimicrobiales bacterium]